MTWPDSTWTPLVLSVDVVLDPTWGDARNGQTQEFWIGLSRKGAIAGVLTRPPCEIFSISRERWWEEQTGPRPLRSLEKMWGHRTLTLRETLQVLVSNDLLSFSARLCLEQYIQGKWATLEHPAEPDRELHAQAPSIWALTCLQILLNLPEVQAPTIRQGFLGARSPKPTKLWMCHAPPTFPLIQEFYTTTTLPKPLTMGRTGRMFNTAPLKEYPKALNEFLAESFRRWMSGRSMSPDRNDFSEE